MEICSNDVRMMRHCRQCRADAIGLLGNDRSQEFIRTKPCGSCYSGKKDKISIEKKTQDVKTIAVATESGKFVDAGFGNTKRFDIYATNGITAELKRSISIDDDYQLYGRTHAEHIDAIVESLSGCDCVVVREIGIHPKNQLSQRGTSIMTSKDEVKKAVIQAFNV